MKRYECIRCGEFQLIPGEDSVVKAYSKPVKVIMIPVYVNRTVEVVDGASKKSMRKWVRVGMMCPRCHTFEYRGDFKPKRHAV